MTKEVKTFPCPSCTVDTPEWSSSKSKTLYKCSCGVIWEVEDGPKSEDEEGESELPKKERKTKEKEED